MPTPLPWLCQNLYWITSFPKWDPDPRTNPGFLSNKRNFWSIESDILLTWAHPAVSLSSAMSIWSPVFQFFSYYSLKPQMTSNNCAHIWSTLHAVLSVEEPVHFWCYNSTLKVFYHLQFWKFSIYTKCGCVPRKTEMCRWTLLTIDLLKQNIIVLYLS